MAKLCFQYGAMGCGKTAALLQVAHNYTEYGFKTLVIKSSKDTKGDDEIVSRIGISRKVDYLITPDAKITEVLKDEIDGLYSILVDEAQFLTPEQVDELFLLSKVYNVSIVCYGIKSDFKTQGFKGSDRLFAVADELNELYTVCSCGEPAHFNARKINDEFVIEGEQVVIDDPDNQEDNKNKPKYVSLCGDCYVEKVLGYKKDIKYPKMLLKNVKND